MKSAKLTVTFIKCNCNDEYHIHYEMHHQLSVSNGFIIEVNAEVEWISLRNTSDVL